MQTWPTTENCSMIPVLSPEDILTTRDLIRIPILNKDAILDNFPDKIVAKNFKSSQYSARMTSGSSGKKLNVLLDHKVAAIYRLMQLRQLIHIGYKPWYHAVYIRYGPPVTRLLIQKFGLLRRSYLPLEWSPEKQLSKLVEVKPQILNAYPSVLYLLASVIKPDQAEKIGLKFVLSNSELLTETARHTIENAFRCKVYDDYSCLEFSAIGFECRKQNLHVASDNVIVEILDEAGRPLPPGERGRIITTSLHNYSMPYIRYEIGDVGILSKNQCPCGRTFPYFQSMLGRSDDFITKPDGTLIDPQTIVFQIETIDAVKEFRILQYVDYRLTAHIVLHENATFDEVERKIRKNLRAVLEDDNVKIDVVRVPVLERGSTGKHRAVISDLASK